eukprot:jgi/Chlat1/4427/Chrsp29S04389
MASFGLGVDYKAEKEKCVEFLRTYVDDNTDRLKYVDMMQEVANRKRRAMDINMDDLHQHFGTFRGKDTTMEAEFANNVRTNTWRYLKLFASAVDECMPAPNEDSTGKDDVFDVLRRQRMRSEEQHAEQNNDGAPKDANHQLPPELMRRYEVRFITATGKHREPPLKLREVRAEHIGHLVSVKGIVTRCGDVKPQMVVATYTCDECGFEIFQMITKKAYMPLMQCPSGTCTTNNTRGRLHHQIRGSKFVKFQEVKLQEMADDVPTGHIPRAMTVHVTGELTRQVAPGDIVEISGVFLPVPFVGFKAMRAGLTADTYVQAMAVTQTKTRYHEFVLTDEMQETIEKLADEQNVYNKLAQSIAPEIFGHEDIKKALLLLMVGGVTAELQDGMKLRGDIHMCMMGDPGVAKSQLLKHIIKVAPRGVYTNGRGSSGVGLTASVTRDPITSEMMLEGGALVLADKGICAIDEFDKMDESDRTAIHEVMEQQTVSIAKAGITTSLNARTAVLAAANPAWGRYDMRRTPAANINMPAALLSRFDILWLMLDRPDEDADARMAQHVLHVHQKHAPPPLDFEPLDAATLRAYIATARKYAPHFPEELTDYVTTAYSSMRQDEKNSDSPHTYTTARTLLSILRLSQALARLRFADQICQGDVDEALRLMQMSKISLVDEESMRREGLDDTSSVYIALKDIVANRPDRTCSWAEALQRVLQKGLKEEHLRNCLDAYDGLNIFFVDPQTKSIRLISEAPE